MSQAAPRAALNAALKEAMSERDAARLPILRTTAAGIRKAEVGARGAGEVFASRYDAGGRKNRACPPRPPAAVPLLETALGG